MAITHVMFGDAGDIGKGGVLEVLSIDSKLVSESIATSTSAATTTISAPSLGGQRPVCVIATDIGVYAAISTNPNAASTSAPRAFIPAGQIAMYACSSGHLASIVGAT